VDRQEQAGGNVLPDDRLSCDWSSVVIVMPFFVALRVFVPSW